MGNPEDVILEKARLVRSSTVHMPMMIHVGNGEDETEPAAVLELFNVTYPMLDELLRAVDAFAHSDTAWTSDGHLRLTWFGDDDNTVHLEEFTVPALRAFIGLVPLWAWRDVKVFLLLPGVPGVCAQDPKTGELIRDPAARPWYEADGKEGDPE